jgi:cellulose synthase/poly-beta-1,6-N-acetylglucosamine synthase-like glycosyltransferase
MSTGLMIATVLFIATLIYFAVLSLWYLILIVTTFPDVIRRFKESQFGNVIKPINKDKLIPITIVTPAFNEEKRIKSMIYNVLHSDYQNINLIVVNDGSTDNMMPLLINEFDLYEIPYKTQKTIPTSAIHHCYRSTLFPNFMVLDKEHSPYNCAADAINAGLNACQTPIMLTVDADTLLEPESLSRLLFTFLSNNHCIAVSGSVYVLNENKVYQGRIIESTMPKGFITAPQGVEYVRSFLYAKAGMNAFGGAMSYPGAFSLFETEIVREVGGFDTPNYSYDAEIVMKLHHWMREKNYPYSMIHTSTAFCWTEVPSTLKNYWQQRDKWQRGMWRSVMLHIKMFFNPSYGTVGMINFPTYLLFEVLSPVVECTSYILLIILLALNQISFIYFFWLVFLAWGVAAGISIAMIFLDLLSFNKYKRNQDFLLTLWVVFYEMLGFRQLRALCCTWATFKYFINRLRGLPI